MSLSSDFKLSHVINFAYGLDTIFQNTATNKTRRKLPKNAYSTPISRSDELFQIPNSRESSNSRSISTHNCIENKLESPQKQISNIIQNCSVMQDDLISA